MIYVFNRRQLAEVTQTLALAPRSDDTKEILQKYIKEAIPYYEGAVKKSEAKMKKQLIEEAQKGPVAVRRVMTPVEQMRSRKVSTRGISFGQQDFRPMRRL